MNRLDFYVNGRWYTPENYTTLPVYDPSTEEAYVTIALGTAADVDLAVKAAREAFDTWGKSSKQERLDYLAAIIAVYERRYDEMVECISQEMGAPLKLAREQQAAAGLGHLKSFHKALADFDFEGRFREDMPDQRLHHEPTGVAALITPWNWPMNQVTLKVGAALAAGCTMVLKPSEIAPMCSMLFTEFVHEAGLPAGVFNMVNGDGAGVGSAMSSHPDVDVISFTGSTRAGKLISKAAADSIKNISLELGGKSPNVVFADTDVDTAVARGASACFSNTGQSCNAGTRMLVERSVYDRAVEVAAETAKNTSVDLAAKEGSHIGPLVSQAQFEKVQGLIETGINEGGKLVAGGVGRPDGLNRGWFAKPTVFADVTPDMTLWREEVFGPVMVMTPFDSEEEAVALANDTEYGLAAYLQSDTPERIQRVSKQLRAGMIHVNGAGRAPGSPFGGYKQSGIGREGGRLGIEEFLEVKTISGWQD